MHTKPPIIIIGMHRSGTTMLSKVLESAGLYQGWRKEENNESTFFIKLNEWILRELGGRWDVPENMVDIATHSPAHLKAIVTYLKGQLDSPRSAEYLGVRGYLEKRSILNQQSNWCWKDPRTTLTLDLWLRIFPEAKIVHIVRHGVDVANSLRERTNNFLSRNTSAYQGRRWGYSVAGKRGVFVDAPRCLSLEGGFSLWEAYVESATKYREELLERYLEFKYEDLLAAPREVVSKIFDFCDLDASKTNEHYLNAFIDQGKGNRFQSDNELTAFSERVADQLKKFGY
jgi:hypothetical protein